MGKDDKYYKSAGKIVKIKCRVESCQKVMLRQRYRNHLVECHPGEVVHCESIVREAVTKDGSNFIR